MMFRKIAGLLTLIVIMIMAQPVSGQESKGYTWTADRPDAEAPMGITDDRIMPAGAFQIGVRLVYSGMSGQGWGTDSISVGEVLRLFDVSPSEMVTQGLAVDFLWGATDELTLAASGTIAQKTMEHLAGLEGQSNAFLYYETDATGIQDLKVSALYEVLSRADMRFHIHGGVSVPVGSIDSDAVTPFSDPEAAQLPYTQQLGSGTFDVTPGFTFNMQNEKASLGIQAKGTIRLNQNDRDWALGDLYEGNLWAGLLASDWASAFMGLRYSNWGHVEGFDRGMDPNESPAHNTLTQAGWRVDIPLGLNFVLPEGRFEGHRLGVEIVLPIHQDLEGPQLRHNWSLNAGWSMAWGF